MSLPAFTLKGKETRQEVPTFRFSQSEIRVNKDKGRRIRGLWRFRSVWELSFYCKHSVTQTLYDVAEWWADVAADCAEKSIITVRHQKGSGERIKLFSFSKYFSLHGRSVYNHAHGTPEKSDWLWLCASLLPAKSCIWTVCNSGMYCNALWHSKVMLCVQSMSVGQ